MILCKATCYRNGSQNGIKGGEIREYKGIEDKDGLKEVNRKSNEQNLIGGL
jgi:hypothetical protein